MESLSLSAPECHLAGGKQAKPVGGVPLVGPSTVAFSAGYRVTWATMGGEVGISTFSTSITFLGVDGKGREGRTGEWAVTACSPFSFLFPTLMPSSRRLHPVAFDRVVPGGARPPPLALSGFGYHSFLFGFSTDAPHPAGEPHPYHTFHTAKGRGRADRLQDQMGWTRRNRGIARHSSCDNLRLG